MLQLHLSDQQVYCVLRCVIYTAKNKHARMVAKMWPISKYVTNIFICVKFIQYMLSIAVHNGVIEMYELIYV